MEANTHPSDDDLDQPVTRRDVYGMVEVNQALADAIQNLAHTNEWRKSARVILYCIVGVLLLYGGALGVVVYQNHQSSQRVCDWATATAARSKVLSSLTAAQLKAIADAFQAIPVNPNSPLPQFTQAQRDELAAYQAYRNAYGDNPLPPTPALAC